MGVDVGSFGATADFWFGRFYNSTDQSKVMNLHVRDSAKGTYKKLVFTPDGKKLLGGILVGDNEDFALLSAIAKRPDLGGLTPQEVLDGKVPQVDDGGDGTNLGPDDLVCNCHSVTKATIVKAIEAGAGSFAEIKKCTKAGTGCGTCITTGPQPRLLAHTLNQLRRSMGISTACPFSAQDVEDLAKARSLKDYKSLMDQISYVGYPDCPKTKADVQPILDKVFNGKKKGDGLDQVSQLKALKKELFEFVDKMNCNPIFVRLAWHDSGTYDKRISTFPERGGANGSIVYSPEIDHGANNGLSKAVKFLESFKNDYPLVSWADLMQMASAVSIQHAGGPQIPMRYGRKDVSGPSQCVNRYSREGFADNAGLPDAEAPYSCGSPTPAQHLRNVFGRMGLDDKAIVALSGAHTLGRAFAERSGTVPEGYGESKACKYTKSVGVCPVRHDRAAGVGMPGGRSWTKEWLKFDNSYFKDYREQDPELLWLSTDRCLHDGSDAAFKQYFTQYAQDQGAFFRDYAEAHKALSELGAEFTPPEGIVID
jgi:L-ascorbate peroxidase